MIFRRVTDPLPKVNYCSVSRKLFNFGVINKPPTLTFYTCIIIQNICRSPIVSKYYHQYLHHDKLYIHSIYKSSNYPLYYIATHILELTPLRTIRTTFTPLAVNSCNVWTLSYRVASYILSFSSYNNITNSNITMTTVLNIKKYWPAIQ